MKITLLVKSNSNPDKPYELHVFNDDDVISLHCCCGNGSNGKSCHHRESLFKNDEKILHDKKQIKEFKTAVDWIKATEFPTYVKEIEEYQKKFDIAKKKLNDSKSKLSRNAENGLPMIKGHRVDLKKKYFINDDGTISKIEEYIKNKMENPAVYRHLDTSFEEHDNYLLIETIYFDGKEITQIQCKLDVNGNLIETTENSL